MTTPIPPSPNTASLHLEQLTARQIVLPIGLTATQEAYLIERFTEALTSVRQQITERVRPTPLILLCPQCARQHIDRDEWRTRLHHVHRCEYCAHEWDVGIYSIGSTNLGDHDMPTTAARQANTPIQDRNRNGHSLSEPRGLRVLIHEYGTQLWTPLETVIALRDRGAFMYMGQAICERGITIYLYKHSNTRRYLNLDFAGRTYRFKAHQIRDEGRYYEIPVDQARAAVLA